MVAIQVAVVIARDHRQIGYSEGVKAAVQADAITRVQWDVLLDVRSAVQVVVNIIQNNGRFQRK